MASDGSVRGRGEGADELAFDVGRALGTELRALGFDIDFAPVLDVNTNPDNPVIGDRSLAAEASRVASLGIAFAAGLDEVGIVGCGKHFPGHGDTDIDSHLALPRLAHDLDRLRSVELVPFAAAARAELPMLMTAHVLFSAIDAQVPATLSARVVTELLRGELGYEGVVVSDDLDMKAIADNYGVGEAAVRAIEAGCDVLLLCRDPVHQIEAREALLSRAKSSEEFRHRIESSAARVGELARRHSERARPDLAVVGCDSHRAIADKLIGEGR